MRELKFRAWDGEEMSHFTIEIDSTGELPLPPIAAQGRPFKELMQNTGLKDKNGKEIYEGDIVRKWCGGEEFCKRNKMTATVEWRDTEFWAMIHDKEIKVKGGSHGGTMQSMGTVHSWMGMHSCMRNGRLEVIGNIYEKPELLTV